MPPILSTRHCEFNGAHLCAHTPLNTNSPVYYTNSTFIVSTITSQQLVQIIFTSFLFGRYKELPSMNNIFACMSFFFLFVCFISSHTFSWACGSLCEPRSFSLFVHSLVCPITHSSLDGFQPNLVQHFPHVCSTCHTVFSLKNTPECVCERLLHCRLIFSITLTPGK